MERAQAVDDVVEPSVPRTERLFSLAEELRRTVVGLTAAELASRFGVTARTIERDLLTLQEGGVVIDRGERRGSHVIRRQHALPPMEFTRSEAIAIAVALAGHPDGSEDSAHLTARRKVMAAMSAVDAAAARRLTARIRQEQLATGELAPAAALQDAIAEAEVVDIRYRSADGTISRRRIEPVALISRDGAWHVVAWCHTGDGHRRYRLDRIDEVRPTGELAPSRQTDDIEGLFDQGNLFS